MTRCGKVFDPNTNDVDTGVKSRPGRTPDEERAVANMIFPKLELSPFVNSDIFFILLSTRVCEVSFRTFYGTNRQPECGLVSAWAGVSAPVKQSRTTPRVSSDHRQQNPAAL
jgi:hypothetical protein